MAPAARPSPWPLRLERLSGVLLILVVVGVYGLAYARGTVPPGHPWSGLTLGLLGLRALLLPAPGSSAGSRLSVVRVAALVLSLAGAGLWLASALLH